MSLIFRYSLATLLLVLSLASALAQWSDDPLQNLAIADRSSEQVIPKVAARADGGCYVGWFDLSSGNYDVYLQYLDATGTEQWPHNGLLVSDHPQNSWLVDWDLIVDSGGNAVLVFADARDGADFDIHAYKVGPGAEMLWGPDGVTLATNNDFEPAPRVAEAGDGALVFVWARMPDAGDGSIQMQRLSPAGLPLLPYGGIGIAGEPGESPGFCDIVSAENGNVIVSWVRDVKYYYSDRHLRAGKFDTLGNPVWPGPVDVFDATSMPIAHMPGITADGAGGALLHWHRSASNMFNAFIQHLDAGGAEVFPHNGVPVSMTIARHHIDPSLSYAEASGEIFVFWNERNSNQSQWGIYGQKFSPAGTREWGETGLELLPVDSVLKYGPRSLPWAGGAMVFLVDEPGGYGNDRVIGMRLDADGNQLWGDSPIMASSLLSNKSRLPVAIDPSGVAKLVWEDDRSGNVDVYGQNVNPDGSLGAGGTGALDPTPAAGHLRLSNHPNPFNPRTIVSFRLSAAARVDMALFDATGRRVRALASSVFDAGAHEIAWDGRDETGRALGSGVYLCRLRADDRMETRRLVLLK